MAEAVASIVGAERRPAAHKAGQWIADARSGIEIEAFAERLAMRVETSSPRDDLPEA